MSVRNLQHLWVHVAEHWKKQRISNQVGGFVETMIGAGCGEVHCRINPASSEDTRIASQAAAIVDHSFYVDPNYTGVFNVNDELTCGDRRFRVTIPHFAPSVDGVYLKVLTQEIQK